MLAHILALMVGLLSFALYMSAFFFPEVYRKSDLTWSGIGLFYALVLWVCAGRITGGVLLGQTASVALLGWLGWQTINLRRELAPIALRTPLPNEAKTIGQAAQLKAGELRSRWQQTKLAEQTNRLAGTIAGWTGSIAQSKKQPPPVGGRSRSSKKKSLPIASAATREAVSEAISKPVNEPVIEVVPEAAELSAAIDEVAIQPPASARSARPARPAAGLFGGLRRNAPQPKSPRSAPPPASDSDLEEFENWEDEETIEPAVTPTAAIEDLVVIIETIDAAIEEKAASEADKPTSDVVVMIETADLSGVEILEVEVIEAELPTDEPIAPTIEPVSDASIEVTDLPDRSESIDPPQSNADELLQPPADQA